MGQGVVSYPRCLKIFRLSLNVSHTCSEGRVSANSLMYSLLELGHLCLIPAAASKFGESCLCTSVYLSDVKGKISIFRYKVPENVMIIESLSKMGVT